MQESTDILVVDDEREIADLVVDTLQAEGMVAHACYSGHDALAELAARPYGVAIIDVMMPGMDGFELCRRIRSSSDIPIVFLSAKVEEADKVVGLTLGADDYVEKPFKRRELVARVRARLRRHAESAPRSSVLSARGIEVDPRAHRAFLHAQELSLTPKEFGVLRMLLEHAGQPVSAHDLYQEVWGEPATSSSANSVMVHIRHLRKKLADIDSSETFIETAWGVGYRIARGPETGGSSFAEPVATDTVSAPRSAQSPSCVPRADGGELLR